MGVSLVQEYGQAGFRSDVQLSLECRKLCLARRKIAEVIEPAFTDGHDTAIGSQFPDQRVAIVRVVGGMVRMHAGG